MCKCNSLHEMQSSSSPSEAITSGKPKVDSSRKGELLAGLAEVPSLQSRVAAVLHSLPHFVQVDFSSDPTFQITLEEYSPSSGWTLFMAFPSTKTTISRCVVLRRRLAQASADFAKYVIAHEFAHAFLRNGGWGEITDIEEAADALAASWGFVRPAHF